MSTLPSAITRAVDAVEEFFDALKLGYKWRYDRWDELQILAYRGYGTRERFCLRGRVLDDKGATLGRSADSFWKNIVNTIRRIETDEIPGARVRLHYRDQRLEAETDNDGYFEFEVSLTEPLPEDRFWHEVRLELLEPTSEEQGAVSATGQVLVPSSEAEFGVISDLDDTVVRTGATDRLRMIRTVLLNNARTRVPFDGLPDFYRALQHGSGGGKRNPIFYVSSSPWNLYGLFEAFMEAHDIPQGPIFLKDFGFSESKFFTRGHEEHKLEHLRMLLRTYPELPFVLVGDSGQKDPETYRQAVREFPGRIRAIFIRDVTPDKRDRQVRAIAEEVERTGTSMVLAEETSTAARHAREMGLISA